MHTFFLIKNIYLKTNIWNSSFLLFYHAMYSSFRFLYPSVIHRKRTESRKIIKNRSIRLITYWLRYYWRIQRSPKSASFSLHILQVIQEKRGRITNLNREPEVCAFKSPGNGDSLSKSPSLISLYISIYSPRGHER